MNWRDETVTKGELHDLFVREAKEAHAAAQVVLDTWPGWFRLTAKERKVIEFLVRVHTRGFEDLAKDLNDD